MDPVEEQPLNPVFFCHVQMVFSKQGPVSNQLHKNTKFVVVNKKFPPGWYFDGVSSTSRFNELFFNMGVALNPHV